MVNNVFAGQEPNPQQMEAPQQNLRRLHQSDIPPNTIEQRHLKSMWGIHHGLAADRPDGSTHVKAYFATDTGVLSLWSGTAWLTTTLT